MAKVRSGHFIIGAGLAVMGYAVLVIAFSRAGERIHRSADQAHTATPVCLPAANRAETPAGAPLGIAPSPPGDGDSGIPMNGDGAASMPGDAAVDGAARGESANAADARLFKFYSGGAAMSRDDALRLAALGKALARSPAVHVVIEGFGDLPGADAYNTAVAKHRIKTAQAVLARAGVTDDRMNVSIGDVATDPQLARSIRLTGTPPLSEVER